MVNPHRLSWKDDRLALQFAALIVSNEDRDSRKETTMHKTNKTEKTPKTSYDIAEVTTESLERYVKGGARSGQNRDQTNHDKSRNTLG
jgi:hypothetical protein